MTNDQIGLEVINGQIPNRGLLQARIGLHGLTYLQQISDANVEVNGAPAGLHIEPGLWINVPPTTDPQEPTTIARLASIPHGTTILVQGTAATAAGGPSIPAVSLTPFGIGQPKQTVDFDEQHLNKTTQFRTSGVGLTGITQAMLDNPNSVLTRNPPTVTSTTRLHVSTTAAPSWAAAHRTRLSSSEPRTARTPTPHTSSPPSGCRRCRAIPNPSGCSTPRLCC